MNQPLWPSYQLVDALREEGFPLPDECADVRVFMPVDGMMQIQYTVNLTVGPDGTLAKVGRALAKLAS